MRDLETGSGRDQIQPPSCSFRTQETARFRYSSDSWSGVSEGEASHLTTSLLHPHFFLIFFNLSIIFFFSTEYSVRSIHRLGTA